MSFRSIFNALYEEGHLDSYKGIDPADHPEDVRGWWSDDPSIGKILRVLRPRLIVEVGTWKGASAIHMANICKTENIETEIVCIDPFCGSAGTWIYSIGSLRLDHGRSSMHELFMANVLRQGHEGTITPLIATSSVGAQILKIKGAQPDLIYIDGSHLERDVLNDLYSFHELCHGHTVLLCDDYNHNRIPGVTRAVRKFLAENPVYTKIDIEQTTHATEWTAEGDTSMKCALLQQYHPLLARLQKDLVPHCVLATP